MCKKKERRHGNLFCDICRGKSSAKRFAAIQKMEKARPKYQLKGNPLLEQRSDQKTPRKRYFVLSPRSS